MSGAKELLERYRKLNEETIIVPTKGGTKEEVEVIKKFKKLNAYLTHAVKSPKRFSIAYKKGSSVFSPIYDHAFTNKDFEDSKPRVGDKPLKDNSLSYILTKEQADVALAHCDKLWPELGCYIAEKKSRYAVTHPKTGLSLGFFSSLDRATKFAKELEDSGISIADTDNVKKATDSITKDQIQFIGVTYQKYHGGV